MTDYVNRAAGRKWPTNYEERQQEHERRIDAALLAKYDKTTIDSLGLFQALDKTGSYITHETKRVVRDVSYVTEVAAGVLVSGMSLALDDDAIPPNYVPGDTEDSDAARLESAKLMFYERGLAVWKRSKMDALSRRWAWMLSAAGDYYLEPTTTKAGEGKVIGHRPDAVEPYYDETGTELTRADIRYEYSDEPREDGGVDDHTYWRQIKPGMVRTQHDESGWDEVATPLSVPTIVHLQFYPSPDPEIGLHAAHGIEDACAVADSILTMTSTIGSHHAAPILKVTGAMVESDGVSAGQTNAILNLPSDADANWLELSMQGMSGLQAVADGLIDRTRATLPEFMFSDAGANASGTALSYRAAHLRMKLEPVAKAWREGIARAINMAVCLELGVDYSEDRTSWFKVEGAAILPQDRAAVATLVTQLVEDGFMLHEDATRVLQSANVGIPLDYEPAEYSELAQTEKETRDEGVAAILEAVARAQGGQSQAGADTTPPE